MFERFTERAIKAIMLAQNESRMFGYNYIGTEQILLGLIVEDTGIAAKVLKSMGLNIDDTRAEVEKIIGRGSDVIENEIPFSKHAKNVLGMAWKESVMLKQRYIGTEHLLLALIREKKGIAIKVFENMGIDLNEIKNSVIKEIKVKKAKKPELNLLKFSLILQIILIVLSITLIVLKCLYK